MEKSEPIYDYGKRFDEIINGMKNLQKISSNVELNRKLLRSLTNDEMAKK